MSNIKNSVDRLASIGHSVSDFDHIEAIFNGLPEDYDTFIISMNSKFKGYTIKEIESLFLAQEAKIENHSKELDSNSSSINLTTHGNNFY